MQDLLGTCACTLDESAMPDCSDDEEQKLHETIKTASDFPSQDDKERTRYCDLTFDGSSVGRLPNNGFCVISGDNQSARRLPNDNGFCVISAGDYHSAAGRLHNNGFCVISGDNQSAGRLSNNDFCVISGDNQSTGRLANHGICVVSAGDSCSAGRLANHGFHVISDANGCASCGLGRETHRARMTRQSAATSKPTTARTASRKEEATATTTRTRTTSTATVTNNSSSSAVDKTSTGRPSIVTRQATTPTSTTKTASGKEEAATKRTTTSAAGKVMLKPSQAAAVAAAAATTTSKAANAAGNADETPERPLRTWSDIVRSARHPQMASFRTRLATLRTWPLIRPSPTELARAGLFHVRSTERESLDSVKCFSCGERLHRWQGSDDALLEHARLAPGCHYVTQVLGPNLHNDVIRATSVQLDSRYFAEEFSQNSSELSLNMAAA